MSELIEILFILFSSSLFIEGFKKARYFFSFSISTFVIISLFIFNFIFNFLFKKKFINKKKIIIKKNFKGTRIQIQKKCVNFILKYLDKLI